MSKKSKTQTEVLRKCRFRDTFAVYLRRVRKSRNFTQSVLAEDAHLSRAHVAHLENLNKDWASPSASALQALAKVLNSNADKMCAKGNRIAQDVQDIIYEHPIEICAFLRAAKHLKGEDWERLTEEMK